VARCELRDAQSRFHGLSKSDIVSDQQTALRSTEQAPDWGELIGFEADTAGKSRHHGVALGREAYQLVAVLPYSEWSERASIEPRGLPRHQLDFLGG